MALEQKSLETPGVDEELQKTWDGGLSASDIFAKSFEEGLVNC